MTPLPKINLIEEPKEKTSKIRRFFLAFGKFIIYILIVLAILISTFSYQIIFSEESLSPSLEKFSFFQQLRHLTASTEKVLKGEHSDRINILLLGMGGLGHEGPYLTDTIIAASFRPSDKKTALLSIPRDLSVYIPKYEWRKINHANSFGELENPGHGGELASQVVSDVLNIPVYYYVRVDFNGFQQLIDDLGGLKIYVERSFIDYEYPAENFEFQTVSFKKGWQVMDGNVALKFARSRHGTNGEGSDFARAARQQKILIALKNKIFSFTTLINPKNVVSILNAFQKNIKTNLEVWEMIRFAKMAKSISSDQIIHKVLDTGKGGLLKVNSFEGAYLLEPITGDFNEIRNLAQNIFEYKEERKETATLTILNGTEHNGLASLKANELIKKGYSINKTGNAYSQNYEKTIVYDLSQGQKPKTLDYLQKEFNAITTNSIPNWLENEENNFSYLTDFVVVLGNNAIPEN